MNPYIILAFVAVLTVTNLGSYHYGGKHMQEHIASEQKKTDEAAIEQHNQSTVIDMQAAVEVEQEKAKQREAELTRRAKLDQDIERKRRENLACGDFLDVASLGLLNASIDGANNKTESTPVLPERMPRLVPPGKRG